MHPHTHTHTRPLTCKLVKPAKHLHPLTTPLYKNISEIIIL